MLRKKHKDSLGEGKVGTLDIRTPMVEHGGVIVARYRPGRVRSILSSGQNHACNLY